MHGYKIESLRCMEENIHTQQQPYTAYSIVEFIINFYFYYTQTHTHNWLKCCIQKKYSMCAAKIYIHSKSAHDNI